MQRSANKKRARLLGATAGAGVETVDLEEEEKKGEDKKAKEAKKNQVSEPIVLN